MIINVHGNIFEARKNQIICHQVSTKGKMGTGIAKTIKKLFPDIYNAYVNICNDANENPLGSVFLAQNNPNEHFIANIFSQDRYGRDRRYTNYEALAVALEKLSKRAKELNMDLAIPYKMGCGNAGGNWNIVKTIIEETCVDIDVYIYKMEED